jgi:hypothetical protein
MEVLVAELGVEYRALEQRVTADAIADAVMQVDAVATVRVDYSGRTAVLRIDVQTSDPRKAISVALQSVATAADALGLECDVVYAEVSQSDESVPFTGRAAVLHWDRTHARALADL